MPRVVFCAGLFVVVGLTGACSARISTGDARASASSSASAPATTGPEASSSPSGGPGVVVPSVTISGLPGGGTPDDGSSSSSGGSAAAQLPPGFPLPPGASVTRVVDDGGEIVATLAVPDSTRAVNFWRTALPAAGYPVSGVQTAGGFGEIRFSGHGCGGDSQLAVQGTTVALQCDRG